MSHTIAPTGSALGAIITELNLSRPLDDDIAASLRTALLEHVLLVFPGQTLTPKQLAKFCRLFGSITRHILDQFHHPEEPDLSIISNVVESGKGRTTARMAGSYWHSDLSYITEPVDASMLYAVEVPQTGGDTLFANLYEAFEALPVNMQASLRDLTAVHNLMSGNGTDAKVALTDSQRTRVPDVIHPVVRRHPETGREALFVNPGFTRRIVELDQTKSDALLAELYAHATRECFIYRHKWTAGDLTLFDGRASMHSATGGYPSTARRTLWRAFMGGRYKI